MKNIRVLLVEDELVIAFDLRSQLKKLGYQVCEVATSVKEARLLIKKHQPDIILLDIRLSDKVPGTVLGKELRNQGKIPFIYITSHFDTATVEEAKVTRPNGYLIKPFSKQDIYVALEMALMNFAHQKIDNIEPTKEISTVPTAPSKIKKVVQYIHENMDKKLTLPELAALTEWNMYYFARMFKKYLNDSPYQYILKVRVEKAKTLVRTTNINLSQVATELGFENHSHFSQSFRKMVGISPSSYRKKHIN